MDPIIPDVIALKGIEPPTPYLADKFALNYSLGQLLAIVNG